MNGHSGKVKTSYAIHRDTGLDLRALLAAARERDIPVALDREAASGMVTHHVGRVTALGADRVAVTAADGAEVRCALWQIDRLALLCESEVAA